MCAWVELVVMLWGRFKTGKTQHNRVLSDVEGVKVVIDEYGKMVWLNDDVSDSHKIFIESFLKQKFKEKSSLCVIYTPDCGCEIEQFVLLDRFPMSPKIISICPVCKKWCHMEISNPILFHVHLLDKDYTLEDLQKMQFMPGEQAHLIQAYKDMRI